MSAIDTKFLSVNRHNFDQITHADLENITHLILVELDLGEIGEIPWELPQTLFYFSCINCKVKTLPPKLPDSLQVLECGTNFLKTLPTLPPTLQVLECGNNQLTKLPPLPDTLKKLYCNGNLITVLPQTLPQNLEHLVVFQNTLLKLPECLPQGLTVLVCCRNTLLELPATLPETLIHLNCDDNHLTVLPPLPRSLKHLEVKNNNLYELPPLPPSLMTIEIEGNEISQATILKFNKILHIRNLLKGLMLKNRLYVRPLVQTEDKVSESDCPICLVEPQTIFTQCNHGFCDCLLLNLNTQENRNSDLCPMCRTPITELGFIHTEVMDMCTELCSSTFVRSGTTAAKT
jgi:Leucine-rich repeat (LRR) protein